jgi:hypothetical protein
MEIDSHRLFTVAPSQERAILDQIRDDHELVARLQITPQEIEALSKCAFLGTLTCKEDMLFILRQIREATSPSPSGQMPVFPEPYSADEEREDPLEDFRQIQSRFAPEVIPEVIPEPGSLEGLVRRRLSEQFGVLFLVAIMAVALLWNGIIAVSRWRDTFETKVGMPVSHVTASEVWFKHLDPFSVLLSSEILSVLGIIGVLYFRSLRGRRRFKVRPGRRY